MLPSTLASAGSYGIPAPGYRLPPEARVGRVVLQIADLERSLRFYTQVIGLRVLARDPDGAVLGAHDDDTPLLELRQLRGATPPLRRGRLGLYHFAILLPERPALGRFLAHLAGLGITPGMADHRVSEALYLADPDGLGIEVYADRPRMEWRARDGELVLATEPLDIPGLLAAGGDEPWRGAPAGTAIGHVHLRVGDLASAEAFYHRGLGLDRMVWSYPGALFLAAGGYHHHLGTNTWAAGAEPAAESDARLLEWELLVPELADAAAALDSVGKTTGAAVQRAVDGGVVRDPWGSSVRLRAQRLRGLSAADRA